MILKENLRQIVKAQREDLKSFKIGILREILNNIDLNVDFAIVLSGIRRCGKSTLLTQLMKTIDNFYYFNFEDSRAANFELSDFQRLDEVFNEEYGKSKYYFFDEIQNIEKWELFVRQKVDTKHRFIITGSNASLLSKELGTRLTGRYLSYELFPFSYSEYLKFTKKKSNLKSYQNYLQDGGIPQYLEFKKNEYLNELFNNVLERDIALRHNIKNFKTLKNLANYLLTNTGKLFSYNSLKKAFNFGSVNTGITYVSYLEDTYLFFTVSKFDFSYKKQLVNPKKIYFVDNGLLNKNSFSFSKDYGRLLENSVFLFLRKTYKNIFYYSDKGECDFVIKEKNQITKAIQVCYDLNDLNKDREINGLVEAMDYFKLKQGTIISLNQEDQFKINGKLIKVIPAWKWMS